jgi:flagellar motor protein MotB
MIEGVKAVPAGRACTLCFDSGVFSSLVTPSDAALKQLKRIADILRPQMPKLKVIVEGYTDDKPLRNTSVYNGNDALALARAEVIRKILVTKGHLPALAVSARHSGGRKPPYPNDSDLNRRRNRTVVLRLVRQ